MSAVESIGADADFLEFIEREHGYLLAAARLEAERRRKVSQEKQAGKALDSLFEAGGISLEEYDRRRNAAGQV